MALTGTPIIIHCAKLTSIPVRVSEMDANKAFGGVPIRVASPPMLAEYPTQSIRHTPNFDFSSESLIWFIIATAIGSIRSVVAVFVIQALSDAVIMIKAPITYFGLVPNVFSMFNAKRL